MQKKEFLVKLLPGNGEKRVNKSIYYTIICILFISNDHIALNSNTYNIIEPLIIKNLLLIT